MIYQRLLRFHPEDLRPGNGAYFQINAAFQIVSARQRSIYGIVILFRFYHMVFRISIDIKISANAHGHAYFAQSL